MELNKRKVISKERFYLLDELKGYLKLMDEALEKEDIELYEKLERDFNHITEQLKYVAKRSEV